MIPLPGVDVHRRVGLLERARHSRTAFTDAIKDYFSQVRQLSMAGRRQGQGRGAHPPTGPPPRRAPDSLRPGRPSRLARFLL